MTVFSFPPDKGNVGTAAYLNVFGSIYRVLKVHQPDHLDGKTLSGVTCCTSYFGSPAIDPVTTDPQATSGSFFFCQSHIAQWS